MTAIFMLISTAFWIIALAFAYNLGKSAKKAEIKAKIFLCKECYNNPHDSAMHCL